MRRLIWDCTVSLCPTKGTPGLFGLRHVLKKHRLIHNYFSFMGPENWPLNTGDCLIQVTFKTGLTVSQSRRLNSINPQCPLEQFIINFPVCPEVRSSDKLSNL